MGWTLLALAVLAAWFVFSIYKIGEGEDVEERLTQREIDKLLAEDAALIYAAETRAVARLAESCHEGGVIHPLQPPHDPFAVARAATLARAQKELAERARKNEALKRALGLRKPPGRR